jgi:hypothetical protein
MLREKSEGNFLYLRQALDGIETDQIDFKNLNALPPGLFGLYDEFFRRRFPDDAAFADVRPLFEVATAAREPLDEAQLAAATLIEPRRLLPQLLRALRVYLPPRLADDGKARYVPWHKSLVDWLTDDRQRGAMYSVDARDGHQRLARACWEEYRHVRQNDCAAVDWSQGMKLNIRLSAAVFAGKRDHAPSIHTAPAHFVSQVVKEAFALRATARHDLDGQFGLIPLCVGVQEHRLTPLRLVNQIQARFDAGKVMVSAK